MKATENGILALLNRLKTRATLAAKRYRDEIDTLDTDDWPRDAEVSLIESLVTARAKEITGCAEIPVTQWTPCHQFAKAIQRSRGTSENDDAQRQYQLGEANFFDGVALWVDHTTDYLTYLNACSSGVVSKRTILFLTANPSSTTHLHVDRELRDVRAELERAGYRDQFELQFRSAIRVQDFVRSLLDLQPAYVHFSGHGMESGAICVEAVDGTVHEIPPSALASLFATVSAGIRCVILNACFSKIQAEAIIPQVPFVIGMNTSIGDEAAIAFSTGFYRAVAAGKDIQTAFELGLVEIRLHGILEHDTPVILHRT